ncbi:MAG: TIGR00159 family protein [Clostridiales bacterium]|nr:TIGR00159 family protein [Clostridiales bacterium]
METIGREANKLLWNIFNRPTVVDLIDIAIIAFMLYQLVLLTRRTRAVQVLKGIAIVIVVSYVSEILGFKALNWLASTLLNNGAIALLILFQPELRRALEQIGRGTKLESHKTDREENARVVEEMTQCLLRLSKRKVGALIVIEGKTGLQDVMETGTLVDASISGALLENIFEPNTPLHDGAVILRGTRVATAGCVLSLSDNNTISATLGTRHRAGLGVSETTDATVLIVSEETGIISMARGGKLTRHLDSDSLHRILGDIYREDQPKLLGMVKSVWQQLRTRKGGKANDE